MYPADIEAVTERFPDVADVCCFAVDDTNYGQNVAVAIVISDASDAKLRALHDWLRSHLAEHQMPTRMFVLDAIPRLAAVNRIRFVLYDAASLRIHAKLVER